MNNKRRKLQISKPYIVNKHLTKLDSLYIEHRIYQRMDKLVDSSSTTKTHEYPPLITKFNHLDSKNAGIWKQYIISALPGCICLVTPLGTSGENHHPPPRNIH